jgi:beta-alanine--pyruvate transaminase
MGAVAVRKEIYDGVTESAAAGIEFFHGYTYSGHPVAAAAGMATLKIYVKEGLLTRAAELSDVWADAVHSLRGLPHVIDLRHLGLMAGIELESRANEPGRRGTDVFTRCFEAGLLVRVTGDIVALSPPLVVEPKHIARMFDILASAIRITG